MISRTTSTRELVDLEDLTGDDFTWLKCVIERHRDETGSEVAARILADWSQQVNHFAKVMPRDYKKVLLAIEAAKKDGKERGRGNDGGSSWVIQAAS